MFYFSGKMYGANAYGIVQNLSNNSVYEVLPAVFQKFDHQYGNDKAKSIETLAHDVLVSGRFSNEKYFKKKHIKPFRNRASVLYLYREYGGDEYCLWHDYGEPYVKACKKYKITHREKAYWKKSLKTTEETIVMNIRKAEEKDRLDIAICIAEGFEKDFSILSKDCEAVANAISSGLNIDKFYVAETGKEIAGVLAISDCYKRAAKTDLKMYRKHLGFIKGSIAALVLKEEFEQPLEYADTTGYIEFVAVTWEYRRKGIARKMIKESMALSKYKEFVLDVTDVNESAIKCYENLGFKEFKRVEEKHGKQKGFNAKIYMCYPEVKPLK